MPLVRNGITFQQLGPWDVNGNPQQLQTFQIGGALARTAAVIALRPEFKTRYSAQLDKIVAFVDQSVFKYWFDKTTGVYSDPTSSRLGGQIPWLPSALGGWGSYSVWNDKCSHFGMMAAWMYQATGSPLYLEYATRVAKGFRTHIPVQNGSWIRDRGIVPITAGANLNGSPDTSHANREPMMVVSIYEAGIEFTLADLQAMASTFTQLIWNQSDADPMFATDHSAQRNGLSHNFVGCLGCPLHHGAVIGKNRDVDMDIAVSSMHMGGDDNSPFAHIIEYVGESFA